jgi:hypothetical protein
LGSGAAGGYAGNAISNALNDRPVNEYWKTATATGALLYGAGHVVGTSVQAFKVGLNSVKSTAPSVGGTAAQTTAEVTAAAKTAAQVEAKVAIQFGKVENQVSHTFRHVEAAGLERSAVQSAVQSHLEGAASQIVAGKPFNAIVEVGGQRLQYTAFRLKDGTLNVGRIHPVE